MGQILHGSAKITPSELLYSDRRLRSKSSPAATILIGKR
jgi:hypothetical protein